MSSSAATPEFGSSSAGLPTTAEAAEQLSGFWWLWLVTGVAWLVAALVILQFDQASIKTIGIILGCMFAFAAFQQFFVAATGERLRWLSGLFGCLFLAGAVICFINPENTFAAMADILGFLLLTVGVLWCIQAFFLREENPIWWLSLIAGGLMVILAFWTSGQFFFEKAYTLLVMGGIWALMQGITDIFKAFAVRGLRNRI